MVEAEQKKENSVMNVTDNSEEEMSEVPVTVDLVGLKAAVRTCDKKKGKPVSKRFDAKEFDRLFLSWSISAFVIALSITAIMMSRNQTNLFRQVVESVDALNWMTSLVLTAVLERVWSKKRGRLNKYLLAIECILVIVGLGLYIALGIFGNIAEKNIYYLGRFHTHLIYIVVSFVVCIGGFWWSSYKK